MNPMPSPAIPSRRTARVLCLLTLAALLAACAGKPKDPSETMAVQQLYEDARDEAANGNWERATQLFERLEARAAGTPLAQQALLDLAYAHHKAGQKEQALSTLARFIKLHPSSPALDYAYYLQGLANFNENLGLLGSLSRQDLSERDQKAAKESFESFRELVTRFPDSRYTPDARSRMTYIVNSLAQYEVHVARYYHSRGAYVAAINRAQTALTDYTDAPALEEALFIMLRSYEALGMTQLRDDTRRVMQASYPQSEYLSKGFKSVDSPWWKVW
jgi:outer membrane protein assembly factor BamD